MLTITLGRSISAGYWSGERVAVRRARRDYPCACGRPEHAITRGSLYLVVTPDRLAAWGGARYTRRLHPAHAAQDIWIVDSRGETVAVLRPGEAEVGERADPTT